MHRYLAVVMMQVEIEAPDESDAKAVIEDCYGEGACGGTEILSSEIVDFAQLA